VARLRIFGKLARGLREVNLEEFNALLLSERTISARLLRLDALGRSDGAQRPLLDLNDLCETAIPSGEIWTCGLLEAFGRHPQIGERAAAGSESSRHGGGEQAGVRVVAESVKAKLAQGIRPIERIRIYLIVCATGKVRRGDACTSRTTLTK